MTKARQTTRERWLNRVAIAFRPEFKRLGYELPKIRISTGFTSSGRKGRSVAECWTDRADPDGFHQIFIDPRDDEQISVVNSVAHELIHAAVGLEHRHRGPFAKVATALGMQAPMTATPSGPEFVALAERIIAKVGPYPHGRLKIGYEPAVPPAGGKPNGGSRPVSTIVTSGPKPQRARLVKAACGGCGYTVRVTRKWLDVAKPICPNKGCKKYGRAMKVA